MAGLAESGIWKVTDRLTKDLIANVRLEYSGDGLRVYIQELGEGEWEENFDALGLLLGDHGKVEQIA